MRARTVFAALLVSAALPGPARAAHVPEVTITFSGHYTSSMTNYLGDKDSSSANLSWTASASGPANRIAFGPQSGRSVTTSFNVGGDLTATIPPPNDKQSCSGNLSPVPGSIVAVALSGGTITVDGIAPVVPTEVQSNQQTGHCAMGPRVGTPYTRGGFAAAHDPRYSRWFEPQLLLRHGHRSASMTWSFSDSGAAGSGTENVNGSDTLTITVGAGKHEKHKKHHKHHHRRHHRTHKRHKRHKRKRTVVCRVPQLRGRTLKAARRLLVFSHCRLGRVKQTGTTRAKPAPSARVIAQRPRPRSVLRRGSPVAVTVKVRRRR